MRIGLDADDHFLVAHLAAPDLAEAHEETLIASHAIDHRRWLAGRRMVLAASTESRMAHHEPLLRIRPAMAQGKASALQQGRKAMLRILVTILRVNGLTSGKLIMRRSTSFMRI